MYARHRWGSLNEPELRRQGARTLHHQRGAPLLNPKRGACSAWRARGAAIKTKIGCHRFRATGITVDPDRTSEAVHRADRRQRAGSGIGYRRYDNAPVASDDPAAAPAPGTRLPGPTLTRHARPLRAPRPSAARRDSRHGLRQLLLGHRACEIATDLMFRSRPALGQLLPDRLQHSLLAMSAEGALRFLGRRPYGRSQGEPTDLQRRPAGARVKFRMRRPLKLYDMTGTALSRHARQWEHTCNTVRPHQALGYLTPPSSSLKTPDAPRPNRIVTHVLDEYTPLTLHHCSSSFFPILAVGFASNHLGRA
jgi:hypothetical protein